MGILNFHKNIKIRLLESFLSSSIGSMVFPFMAIYLSKHFGVKQAGLLLLVNVFVGIIMNFFGGYFSDQFGRKKTMVFAETIRLLAFITMMLCNSPWFTSPLITFFMMTLNSICWGLAGPANQAMLIDVSKPEERKLMYSIMYWSNNLSIAIGGMLGGFLFKSYLFELLLALSVASLVTWVLITFFVEESLITEKTETKTIAHHAQKMISNYRDVFQDKLFILYVLAGLLVLSMEFQLTNYISIRLANDFHTQHLLNWTFGGIEMNGFLRTENTILVVVMALFASKIVGKLDDRKTLIWSCIAFVGGYAVISYSNSIWLLFIAMFIATVAEVLRVPVQQNYMANLPADETRSSYMAVAGLTFNLAMFICSITVSLSAYLSNFATSFFLTSLGVIGILIFVRITPALERRIKGEILQEQGQTAGINS
ncbi:MDR family MFS transporter [Gottfriedia acidiceleris]|uniref:MFS transporter n=1 Tax=Gottfriedia acidiceleris TaxID=371036 RepID=A0ABY4JMG9_9BACI|nr:MFS transporter [Gottfriedia acidiceleris]UPM55019.1 MFS transporter [Gottfriedia acidiceleris]